MEKYNTRLPIIEDLGNLIKNLINPTTYLHNLFNMEYYHNQIINEERDINLSIKIRFFIKYHTDIFLQNSSSYYKKLISFFPLTYDIIKDYFFYIKLENKTLHP